MKGNEGGFNWVAALLSTVPDVISAIQNGVKPLGTLEIIAVTASGYKVGPGAVPAEHVRRDMIKMEQNAAQSVLVFGHEVLSELKTAIEAAILLGC
jgi:hypothetical protein